MRDSCRLAADVLDSVGKAVQPGVTSQQLDDMVFQQIVAAGAYPSPLEYGGFTRASCISINEVVCHGIPDSRAIEEGDVVSIDVSCYLNGYHGDNCRTFIAGEGSEEAKRLVEAARDALNESIPVVKPGAPLREIGRVIGEVCKRTGYESVRMFCGHGVGRTFHTQPLVYHYPCDTPFLLLPGMTFTIEPMITEGKQDIERWDDDWTIVTADGGLCAQFEHTLLVTDSGAEVLTRYEGDGLE
jgi:methionyl aminopeptidase